MSNNTENNLSQRECLKIIRNQASAYHAAHRSEQGKILDSLHSTLKMHRKALIRALNREYKRIPHPGRSPAYTQTNQSSSIKKDTRGRPRKYTMEVEAALTEIWEDYNHICAERLFPQVNIAIDHMKRDKDWHYSTKTEELLRHMPLGTMKQYLVRLAKDKGLMRGFSTTRTSALLNAIPIFHDKWSDMPVGYGQIDTVVHSGPRLEGIMAYTVSFIEMQTYWQEFRAQLGKTAVATRQSLSRILQKLPYRLTGIHSDTGDEFINSHVLLWCQLHHTEFTRSRPYEKNDNANVEERNRHIVREYVGYERYDCIEAVNALNQLYEVLRLYVNYFQPIMKIKEKAYLPNGHQVRKYDTAKTPYERVMEHPDIPQSSKNKLTAEYQDLSPKRLLVRIKALTTNLERIQREQGYHFNVEEEKQ